MKKLLLIPLALVLLAATYGPPFSVSDLSSLTNRPNPSAINPAAIVVNGTNSLDAAGGLFIYLPTATNAVDNDTYFATTSTGRWVRVDRQLKTIISPLLLSAGSLSLASSAVTPGTYTNTILTVNSNGLVTFATNGTIASGGSSSNWYAYIYNISTLVTNFALIGNDTLSTYGPLTWHLTGGSNIYADIATHTITDAMLDYVPTNTLKGSDMATAAGAIASVGDIQIGANLQLSGGVLSAITSSGTNTWQIGVDGTVVNEPNLADGTYVTVSASGSDITFTIPDSGASAGTYTNATVTVNAKGFVTSISSGTGGDGVGAGTNAFINGVLVQPLRITNSTSVLVYTNGSGDITFNVSDYDGFWSDLTNALVADANVSFVYTNNTIRISASAGGGSTNGTVVTVDGGADLTRANFADTTGIGVAASGTNVNISINDRDFGDVTTSSSGTVMTIDNSAITSNKLAAANVTQDKLSATGTGTSTNFLAGDYTYKQVTTNMIPGLVSDITSLQKALSFTNGVTNVNNVVSVDLAAGSNITFSTNNGKITIASSGGGSFTISTNNLGFLSRSATIVTNTETGGEVTHATFAIPANTLGVDGDEVEMHVAGQWLPYTADGPKGYIYRLLYDDDSLAQLITGTLATNIFPASSSTLSPDWLFRIKRVDSNTVFISSVHSVGNQYNDSNPTNLVNDTRVRYLDLQGSDTLDNATVTLSFTIEIMDDTMAATMKTYGYIMSKVGSGSGSSGGTSIATNWFVSPTVSGSLTTLNPKAIQSTTTSSWTPDFSAGRVHQATLNGNLTLNTPSNISSDMLGQKFTLIFVQDSTGNRTISPATNYLFGTDITGLTLTTNGSYRDYVDVIVRRTNILDVVGFSRGYQP